MISSTVALEVHSQNTQDEINRADALGKGLFQLTFVGLTIFTL